jgi:hypothetical protein
MSFDREPEVRKKQVANNKRKDKGNPYASSKHVRIELENQYRHSKKNVPCIKDDTS